MQSYMFMWCRRFQEGSNLNIEIHECFRRPKIFRSKNISQDNLLCKVSVKFNDLWEHLVSEAQQETSCELIFASFISHLLRVPQRTSRRSSLILFQGYNFGLSPRYASYDCQL